MEHNIEGIIYKSLPNGEQITQIGTSRIGNPFNVAGDLETGDIATKLVNAVEIDWNGALFSSAQKNEPTEINTTGDLIGAIKWASENPIKVQEVTNAQGSLELLGNKDVILVELAGNISSISFSPSIDQGKSCHVIFKAPENQSYNVSIGGDNILLPEGESDLQLVVPMNGFCEVNFLNIQKDQGEGITEDILYVRGI